MNVASRALSLAALVAPAQLMALEPGTLGGTPVLLELSESATVYYNFDNRDSKPNQVATRTNDDFGLVYNRFTAQATAGATSAGVRLDHVWFYASPDAVEIALELTRQENPQNPPGYFRSKLDEAGLELSNRYIDWLYPAKYFVTHSTPQLELTLGDAHAQLGRGIVLSVRKQDELGSDTTVRGARLTWRAKGTVNTRITLLGGELNPLRIDEASGRYLGVRAADDALGGVAQAGMPRAIATDFAPLSANCTQSPTCSYAPDRVAGAQLELSFSDLTLSTQGSLLLRQAPLSEDVVRSAERVVTVSQALDLPRLTRQLGVYAELAFQELQARRGAADLEPGYGAYASASFTPNGAALTLEARHYRRLFPLYANVKLARAREFSTLSYSAVPTTAPLDNDTEFEGMNTCVSGARLHGDVSLRRGVRALGSFAHYVTFAESSANEACETNAENRNHVSDLASGFALDSSDRRRHLELVLGGRVDQAERDLVLASGGRSRLFYTEAYLRHELELGLLSSLGLSLSGRHRRRARAEGGPGAPWWEGEEVLGFELDEQTSFAVGFEYDTQPAVPGRYFNVELAHRPAPDTRIALFAGQRRGAQRCVGGICRLYPPFEGVRLDFSTRF
jgi:hypothetical protein